VPVAPRPTATPTRAFSLALSSPSANLVISDDAATATLRSSGVVAPPPSVYVSDSGMIRPAVGTASANFTVSLGSASSAPVTVTYATTDGSATAAGGDYTATVGTVTFAPGETAKTVAVTVAATGRHSVMDSFGLVLSSPTGAIIGDGSATGRLTSRNGLVTIRATETEAKRAEQAWLAHNRTPPERLAGDVSVWTGTPEQIAETMLSYRRVGFDTFIVELPAPYDDETMTSLATVVRPMVAAAG